MDTLHAISVMAKYLRYWLPVGSMDSDSWIQIWHTYSCLWIFTVLLTSVSVTIHYSVLDARNGYIRSKAVKRSSLLLLYLLVLDRVPHFWPIPIHRFFAVNRIRYRYDTDFLIRFKSGRGAAWLTDQRLQTPPPPQLITAVRRGPVAARRRMPLICRGQWNTTTISKV